MKNKGNQQYLLTHALVWDRMALSGAGILWSECRSQSTKRGGGGQQSLRQVQTSAEASPLRGVGAASNL